MSAGLVGADALLSEADGFDLSTGFGYDDVGFGWVVWGGFWFVVACDSGSGEPGVAFWFACSHLCLPLPVVAVLSTCAPPGVVLGGPGFAFPPYNPPLPLPVTFTRRFVVLTLKFV